MPAQAALNHDNAAGLASVTPQPAMSGLIYPDIRYAANLTVARHGKPITRWSYGFLTPAQKAAIEALLGISETVKSAEATIRTLTNDFATYANYNVTAVLYEPEDGYRYYGGRFIDVVYLFKDLEALA